MTTAVAFASALIFYFRRARISLFLAVTLGLAQILSQRAVDKQIAAARRAQNVPEGAMVAIAVRSPMTVALTFETIGIWALGGWALIVSRKR